MYYLVAHSIKKIPIGSWVASLPLHMTLVHWFESNLSSQDLAEIVRHNLADKHSFEVVVGNEAKFGLNHDVAVNVVERSPQLLDLHQSLVKALASYATHSQPQWVGTGWHPHVTHQKNERLQQGDHFVVDSADVISSTTLDGDRNVVARVEF